MSDPHKALLRCFDRDLRDLCDFPPEIRAAQWRPWASATFTGARHRFTLLFGGDALEVDARRFACEVEDYEFDLPGHLVADVQPGDPAIEKAGVAMTLEILTIEIC